MVNSDTLTFEDQCRIIRMVYELRDFDKVVYPVVTSKEYGYINAFDLTDILTVIKDMDISRYIKMDTLARDYCIEICEKLINENY